MVILHVQEEKIEFQDLYVPVDLIKPSNFIVLEETRNAESRRLYFDLDSLF
ncbi:hypothetical protein ZOSMA_1250G00010 [Zostera marina]|uniref:Uncharacterized protein n=1 Tax=Zostera marina TaxID=29655 RepID=A0A0K9Q0E2_ZOSMR|nr:hypothetical protein ZOSMA_1250G00010 [Zostera marina]